MRRRAPIVLAVVGLTVSACGGSTLTAHKGVAVMPMPLIETTTTTTVSATSAVAVAGAPVQVGQTQATQLEAAEEQYALCFAYARLDQALTQDTLQATTPVAPSCSTSGLTAAEVQVIQDLIVKAS
jgi:hypothetical protein